MRALRSICKETAAKRRHRYLASAVSSFPFLLSFQCALPYALPCRHRNHQDMFRIAQEAIDKFSVLQEAASTIKKTCDQKFSPTWCVGVGFIYLSQLCCVSSSFSVYFEFFLAYSLLDRHRDAHNSHLIALCRFPRYLNHSPQALHCRQKLWLVCRLRIQALCVFLHVRCPT